MTELARDGSRRPAEPRTFASWTERAANYAASTPPARTPVAEAVASLRRQAAPGLLSA